MKKRHSKVQAAQLFVDQAIVVTLSQEFTWSRFIEFPTKLFASPMTAEGAP